jgi:hypothetical protein
MTTPDSPIGGLEPAKLPAIGSDDSFGRIAPLYQPNPLYLNPPFTLAKNVLRPKAN